MSKKYNCVKNGIPYFRKTKTIGKRANGTAIKKEFYGDGEKDADNQINEYMNLIERGIPLDFEKVSIEQLMKKWLFDVLLHSKSVKSASFEKHETNYRLYIENSQIGSLPVYIAISTPVQLYYNYLYKEKKLESTKIFDINKTLRKFFNYAITLHYLTDNPCSLEVIEIPGDADFSDEDNEGNDIQVFTDDEMKIILENLKYVPGQDNTLVVSLMLDFVTGLRKGELLRTEKEIC